LSAGADNVGLSLRFLGHAAFDLRLGGVRLCLDPHRPGAVGGRFHLPEIKGPFDAFACTHQHEDHAGWTAALGTMRQVQGGDQIGRVAVTSRAAFHDREGGTRMGLVRMLSFEAEGLRVVHCGDLGEFGEADVAWLRGADVLLVPVGGVFTLGAQEAARLVHAVQPRVAVPMHAADPRVDLQLEPVQDFLRAVALPFARLEELTLAAGAAGPSSIAWLVDAGDPATLPPRAASR